MDEKIPSPPAVNSLLSTPSRIQSVLFGRDPPTERENEPRAATSLVAELWLKKLPVFVSEVVPGVRVASCTKSRPLRGSCATCSEVITWPSEGFVVSTATSVALTSTCEDTVAGDRLKSSSRCSSIYRRTSLRSTV